MSNPLVSVIIPTYNQAKFLVEALESVFAQTLTDYEVIVVDDGSTDDTAERLKPFADRIRLFKTENNSGSPGISRNQGINAATGKYIATLDHDDLWLPEKLAVQVAFMENHPECVGCIVHWSLSTQPQQPIFESAAICDSERMIKRPIRIQYQVWFWITSAQLVRRQAIKGIHYGTRLNISGEDREFQIKLFAHGDVGVAGDKSLAIYRLHNEGFSQNQPIRDFNTAIYLRNLYTQGDFNNLNAEQQEDVLYFLAMRSRGVLIKLLKAQARKDAWELYRNELPWLLRSQHRLFTFAFPILWAMPTTVIKQIWSSPRY